MGAVRPAGRLVLLLLAASVAGLAGLAGGSATARAVPGDRVGGVRDADTVSLPARLDALVPELLARHAVPGLAVGLVEEGRVLFAGGWGWADSASGRPVTEGTVFNVASLSKPVTAWGVLHLAEARRLDLDAPVASLLEDWRPPPSEHDWEGVTLRRLLSHTAGLSMPSVPWFPADSAVPELDAVLRGEAGETGPLRLVEEPGMSWSYSGGGYALLQRIVEEVSGAAFPAYMRRRVFEPLGMTATTFARDSVPDSRAAVPHDEAGNPIAPYRLVGVAAGGLHGTVRDFSRLLAAYSGGDGEPAGRGVLSPEGMSRMLSPVAEVRLPDVDTRGATYGLGHNLLRAAGGERMAFHSGGNPGFLAYFLVVPESGDGVVVLANSGRAVPVIGEIVELWARDHGLEPPPLY